MNIATTATMTEQEWMYDIISDCEDMLKDIGVETGEIDTYSINNRLTKRLGRCIRIHDITGDYFKIELSPIIFNNENLLYNTIIHEMLHTCNGCFGHTGQWKVLADKVKSTYGYDITRVTNIREYGIEPSKRKTKYIVECPNCGKRWGYQRMCNVVKYTNLYKHIPCNCALVRNK